MTMPKLILVLPAYNEERDLRPLIANLEPIFERLAHCGHEHAYVIVDDGSTDATPEILRDLEQHLPVTAITHSPNQGLGPTIRDGLKMASELAGDQDIIFAMDADNSHPAGLMIRMTEMILEGNDVVIASRYRPGARVVGLEWHRRLMSLGARLLFQFMFPIAGVRDYTCGYRAYRARLLKKAFAVYGNSFVEHEGFQSMADILLKLSRLNAIINEAPMILRYDLKTGTSKMRVGRTVLNTLRLMLKRRFQSLPTGEADPRDRRTTS